MSNIVDAFAHMISVDAKNKHFIPDTIINYIGIVLITIIFGLIVFIIGGDMTCIQVGVDPTVAVTINTSRDLTALGGNIATKCSSHIRWNTVGIYVERLVLLCVVATYLLYNTKYAKIFNRYDTIINHQFIPQYLRNIPVNKTKDYRKAMKFKIKEYIIFQICAVVALVVFFIVSIVCVYAIDEYRELFLPVDKHCPKHMFWGNVHTYAYECHFKLEWEIFVFLILTQLLSIGMIFSILSGIINMIYVFCRFDKIYPISIPSNYIRELSNIVDVENVENVA